VQGYLTKAGREAKQHTTWTTVREDYEGAVRAFADALMTGDAGAEFRRELSALVRRVAAAGAWTSLARTLLYAAGRARPTSTRATSSGCWRPSNPDNRRPVDWAARASLLAAPRAPTRPDRRGGPGEDEAAWWAPRSPARRAPRAR
jgi:(1->4)-alpha-D-glucan 1-alpha-D-glucosylmutase